MVSVPERASSACSARLLGLSPVALPVPLWCEREPAFATSGGRRAGMPLACLRSRRNDGQCCPPQIPGHSTGREDSPAADPAVGAGADGSAHLLLRALLWGSCAALCQTTQ